MHQGYCQRLARLKQGMTLDDMADKVGLSKPDLCLIEHAPVLDLARPEIRLMAAILQVSFDRSQAMRHSEPPLKTRSGLGAAVFYRKARGPRP